MIEIEVCYASASQQHLIPLQVPVDTTVIRAIMLSGILDLCPEIELTGNVGIFSQKVSLTDTLKAFDRVEIYRNLKLTPNQARLLRAKKK